MKLTQVWIGLVGLMMGVVSTGCGSDTSDGSSGSGGPAACDASSATDLTMAAAPTVKFGTAGPGSSYSPACIKIKSGQSVTWDGNFAGHPLQGGSVSGGAGAPDP